MLVRGSALGNGGRAPRIAVTLEPARAPELAQVIADAYGLTARERRVTELVAHGLSNVAIAAQLYLSPYTVQDHLKAIFEKLEVSSRGQLVARLFVDHSLGRGQRGSHRFSARLDRQDMVEDLVGIPSALRFLEFLVVPAVVQLGPWDA